MKHDQFTLPFLDTTIVAEGFGLYAGFPTAKSSTHAQINVEPEEAKLLDTPVPTKPSLPAQDYRLVGDRRLAESWKGRAEDNVAAIRVMTAIEAEGRHARSDEQERLAKFTAFGAVDLAETLFRRAGDAFAPAWEDLGVELEGLVSRDDLANLKRATQYAHYTPEFMVRAIWRTLRRMGFDGGRVLEPGCGAGLFFALSPEALVGKLALTGVEMDPTTARIAKLLYPNALIRHEDFTKARLPELYDLAIGNPPFSDRTVRAEDPAGELRLSLHDYFIARSVERLRPGGLAAFVTSRWTMDKVDGNQFALAKAIASGDERLMRKAGIASEIARLERLRDSHFDDQFAIRRKIGFGEKRLEDATRRIEAITQDLARRIPTRGDAFTMTVGDRRLTERKAAAEALIAFVRKMKPQKPGATAPIAAIGGFTIVARTSYFDDIELRLDRALKSSDAIAYDDVTPLGLVSRLESALGRFEVELVEERRTVSEVSGWLPGFKARLGDAFPHETELEEKRAEMAELDASLAATANDAPTPASNAAA